ncbi:MAG: hypothetical protein ACLQNE_36265 [Thermoguttaceae bacterium]
MTISQLAILTTFAEDGRRATFSRNFVGGGGSVIAAECEGKSITAINYTVLADKPESRRSESLPAMFVGDRFEKFIRWEVVDYHGTRSSRPRRMKVGDYCGWLTRAMNSEGVSIEDYKKEVKSITAPSEHIDPGLTAAYLLLRAMGTVPGPGAPASEKDYLRNAALRDQFNAVRLSIGMSESEVEAVLRAKPLESGKVEAGLYRIYGSNESFDASMFIHFSNILVVFAKGKATAISSIPAGYDWRRRLGEATIGLPAPPRP